MEQKLEFLLARNGQDSNSSEKKTVEEACGKTDDDGHDKETSYKEAVDNMEEQLSSRKTCEKLREKRGRSQTSGLDTREAKKLKTTNPVNASKSTTEEENVRGAEEEASATCALAAAKQALENIKEQIKIRNTEGVTKNCTSNQRNASEEAASEKQKQEKGCGSQPALSEPTSRSQTTRRKKAASKKVKETSSPGIAKHGNTQVTTSVDMKGVNARVGKVKSTSSQKPGHGSLAIVEKQGVGAEAKSEGHKSKRESQQDPLLTDVEASQTLMQLKKRRLESKQNEKQLTEVDVDASQKPTTYNNLLSENARHQKIKQEKVDEINTSTKQVPRGKIAKGKYEKDINNWLHPRKPLDGDIKTGMEVGLTSQNSEQLVALGTVQKNANADFVEVLVNMVLNSTTVLPHPKGRMTIVRHAEAHCIRWPKRNVSPIHEKC